jgi:hypothetical protein
MLTNYVQMVSFVFWRRLSDGVEWNGAVSGPVESRPQPASAVDQPQTLLQDHRLCVSMYSLLWMSIGIHQTYLNHGPQSGETSMFLTLPV